MTRLYTYRNEDTVSWTSEVINQARHSTDRETEAPRQPLPPEVTAAVSDNASHFLWLFVFQGGES